MNVCESRGMFGRAVHAMGDVPVFWRMVVLSVVVLLLARRVVVPRP
jgi:hypothetical protein